MILVALGQGHNDVAEDGALFELLRVIRVHCEEQVVLLRQHWRQLDLIKEQSQSILTEFAKQTVTSSAKVRVMHESSF